MTDAFSCESCLGVNSKTGEGTINRPGIFGFVVGYVVVILTWIFITSWLAMLDSDVPSTDESAPHGPPPMKKPWYHSLTFIDSSKVLIMYVQYLFGIIGKLPLHWPTVLSVPLRFSNKALALVLGASASLDCVFQAFGLEPEKADVPIAAAKALINLYAFMVTYIAVLGLMGCLRYFFKRCGLKVWSRADWATFCVVALLVNLFFWYPTISRVAIGTFACVKVCGGDRYWVLDMRRQCPIDAVNSHQWMWAFAVGVPACFLCAAVPLFVVIVLLVSIFHRSRHDPRQRLLETHDFQKYFAFMISGYRVPLEGRCAGTSSGICTIGSSSSSSGQGTVSQPLITLPKPSSSCYHQSKRALQAAERRLHLLARATKQWFPLFWDVVIHVQTVILVTISIFGLLNHEYYQLLLLCAVFGLYLILILWLRPFKKGLQELQAAATALLFWTCLLSLVFVQTACHVQSTWPGKTTQQQWLWL
jgi:hypothetical protein